jgi:hypothetical protein
MKQLIAVALILSVFGMCVGCGGGTLRTGGLGIFGVSNLRDEPISMDDMPPSVRTRAEAAIVGKKLEGIIRNARPRDGRWYYTITYSDQVGGLKEICYWGDGTVRP